MLGRPGISDPVRKNVIAGAWFTAPVCMDLMKHTSSAMPAVCGRKSHTHAPLLPCCLNPVNGGSASFLAPAVIVETANPAKFPEEVEKVVGWAPDVPAAMTAGLQLPEDYDRMEADYEEFRRYLLERHPKS